MYRIVCLVFLLGSSVAVAADENPTVVGMDELVASVVATHPELAHYRAEIEAARADGRAARAWADPELTASFGRKSVNDSGAGLSREGQAWSVSLAQTFEWPGRLTLRKAVADRDLALAELALEGFQAELSGRVRVLGSELIGARRRAAAVAEVASRFRELRETFLARESGGLTPQLEIRVIEAQELVLQRRATDAQLDADTALIALNLLRGARPDASLDLEYHAAPPAAPPEVDVLMALALERNVSFRARVIELERQGLRVRLARHEKRPSVTLAPFIEQEQAGERERTVGLGVSLPLPIGARSGAAADAAEARRVQAGAALDAARVELERDIITALHAHRMHRADMERWPAAAIAAFRDAAATADRHYRLGAVSVSTYLELQSAYLDAVEALLESETAALHAALELESLTSGGWRAMEVRP